MSASTSHGRSHEVKLLLGVHAGFIVDVAVRAGQSNDLAAELGCLAADAPGHVSETGDRDPLSFQLLAAVLKHAVEEVDSAEACRFLTDLGSAVGQTLAGQGTGLGSCGEALVLAVQVADLTGTDADIAACDVRVGTEVTVQGIHVALAEAHDLTVALASGIEVRAAGGTADGQSGQSVLVGLLKAEELHHGGSYGRMEAKSALERSDGAVELDTEAVVGVDDAVIIDPRDQEGEHSLRLHHAAQEIHLLIARIIHCRRDHFQPGQSTLKVLRLVGIESDQII